MIRWDVNSWHFLLVLMSYFPSRSVYRGLPKTQKEKSLSKHQKSIIFVEEERKIYRELLPDSLKGLIYNDSTLRWNLEANVFLLITRKKPPRLSSNRQRHPFPNLIYQNFFKNKKKSREEGGEKRAFVSKEIYFDSYNYT